jgi:hypothetical protein
MQSCDGMRKDELELDDEVPLLLLPPLLSEGGG